ncbi:MAG TPA: acyltransferase [Longimicrobium sp.]
MKARIDSLDYLRGLFAASVMVYHFYVWSGAAADPFTHALVYKLGVYAVGAFYVISGISFAHVYRQMRLDGPSLISFYTKRFYRLAPLYWAAMAAGVVLVAAQGLATGNGLGLPGLGEVLLNASLTFGIVMPEAYMVTGGWSIGNEMAFYLLFPLILLGMRGGRAGMAIVAALTVATCGVFAFWLMTPNQPLAAQWTTYIHPLNQVHLFVAGVAVASLPAEWRLSSRAGWGAFAALAVAFALLPLHGDTISIVTGWQRVAYSVVCIGLCAAAYVSPLHLPGRVHAPLAFLGQSSYSVYLLHPLVYQYTDTALSVAGIGLPRALLALPATLVVSSLAYRWIEAPMVDAGKRRADAWSGALRTRSAAAVAV